jgi:2,4-dienoyl-CoA reductase-like NADH-dependent reductase (Old Yellow Enzyme family)
MSLLFSPLTLPSPNGGLTLPNRIVVAPMCQYNARDGEATDWHLMHWGNLLNSGAALFTIEATAVLPEGRITPGCLGLWDERTEAALASTLQRARRLAPHTAVCIQLAHAGRKASSALPWEGGQLLAAESGGWQTFGPSAEPQLPSEPPPTALSLARMAEIKAAFVRAAERAQAMGIEAVELHGAHGYLIHEFLSPLANHRDDEYGGSFENRIRFPMEVFAAVRAVFKGPLGMRLSASDWVEGAWDGEQSGVLAQRLKAAGCDFIHVSSGGLPGAVGTPGARSQWLAHHGCGPDHRACPGRGDIAGRRRRLDCIGPRLFVPAPLGLAGRRRSGWHGAGHPRLLALPAARGTGCVWQGECGHTLAISRAGR